MKHITSCSGGSRRRRPAGQSTGPSRASRPRTRVLAVLCPATNLSASCGGCSRHGHRVVAVNICLGQQASLFIPSGGRKSPTPSRGVDVLPMSWWANLGVATPDQWQSRSTPQPGWPEPGLLCASLEGATGERGPARTRLCGAVPSARSCYPRAGSEESWTPAPLVTSRRHWLFYKHV